MFYKSLLLRDCGRVEWFLISCCRFLLHFRFSIELEFVAIVSRKVDAGYTLGEVKHAFSIFQQEGDQAGHVTFDALVEGILKYGEDKMGRQQVIDLVSQLEKNNNGLINYADFVDLMMR